jgi:hypothetical protein
LGIFNYLARFNSKILDLAEGFRRPDLAFFVLNFKAALWTRSNPKRVVAGLSRGLSKTQAQSEVIWMSPGPPPHIVDAAPFSKRMFQRRAE